MESESSVYKHVAGIDVDIDVYWPSAKGKDEPRKYPIAIGLHGGGFVVGSKKSVPQAQIRALVELGFIVGIPNYRLCPQVSLWEGPIADVLDAVKWIRTELPKKIETKSHIAADVDEMVAFGHSNGGCLALHLGGMVPSIKAVLDFYGGKFYDDARWTRPNPYFASSPDYPGDYCEQVFQETLRIEADAVPKIKEGELPPPRNAWLSMAFKNGEWLGAVVKDDNFVRIDPAKLFSRSFPPTLFIHGKSDTLTSYEISVRAYEKLKSHGAETQILLAEGEQHMFDLLAQPGDTIFTEYVEEGFRFLAAHVKGIEPMSDMVSTR